MNLLIEEAEAMKFVQERHNPLQTYGEYPYFYHLFQVVSVAKRFGYGDDREIVISCWLHDVLEDTATSYRDVRNQFGANVADIVYCVTDEIGKTRREKKEKSYPKIRDNYKAVIVKLCDRIANVSFGLAQEDKGKSAMYAKEFPEFKKALFMDYHVAEDTRLSHLWTTLEFSTQQHSPRKVEVAYPNLS